MSKNWKISKPAEVVKEADALVRMKQGLEKMQLRMIPRPLKENGEVLHPALPPDLTVLNDVQLGRLFSEFCLMAQYAQLRLAVFGVEKAVSKQAEKYMRAKVRLMKEGTVGDKDAQVEVDPLVRKQAIETLSGEGIESLTQAMLQAFLIGRDAVSRELTRRVSLGESNELSRRSRHHA